MRGPGALSCVRCIRHPLFSCGALPRLGGGADARPGGHRGDAGGPLPGAGTSSLYRRLLDYGFQIVDFRTVGDASAEDSSSEFFDMVGVLFNWQG